MPYMKLDSARKLTFDQKKALAAGLGEAMELIPGKRAEGLLQVIDDAMTMLLGGKEQDDCIFVKTDYCGHFGYAVKYDFTVAVFDAVHSVLGTPKDRISMKLEENDSWCNFGDYIEVDAGGNPKQR